MDGKIFRFHDYTGTFVLLAAFSKKTHKTTKVRKKSSFTQFKAFYDALNESYTICSVYASACLCMHAC